MKTEDVVVSPLKYLSNLIITLILIIGMISAQWIYLSLETLRYQSEYDSLIERHKDLTTIIQKQIRKMGEHKDKSSALSLFHLKKISHHLNIQLTELEIKMMSQTYKNSIWDLYTPNFYMRDWTSIPELMPSRAPLEMSTVHLQHRVCNLVYGVSIQH